jgi:SAM-dependent methyltransferase
MVDDEARAVAERYARRADVGRYDPGRPEVRRWLQEREQAMLELLAAGGLPERAACRVVDVGCGAGSALADLLRLGFAPSHLQGVELIPERHALARKALPDAVQLHLGDATEAPIAAASQDLVLAFTVFSSLLDDGFQQRLADAMWRWLKPGGAALWYDFTVNNPRNRDVRGVPLARIKALFPGALPLARRVTLAPPLARAVCRVHPALYGLFNALPLLRTHRLVWLGKPR